MYFKGDVIITDPCYAIRIKSKPDHWELCNYGKNMESLGITNYITKRTLEGDWFCQTVNSDTCEIIGKFCSDSGLVSVFLLSEILDYNPKFNYHITRPHTTTLIKDFDGEITIEEKTTSYMITEDDDCEEIMLRSSDPDKYPHKDTRVVVSGKGNINFYTQ